MRSLPTSKALHWVLRRLAEVRPRTPSGFSPVLATQAQALLDLGISLTTLHTDLQTLSDLLGLPLALLAVDGVPQILGLFASPVGEVKVSGKLCGVVGRLPRHIVILTPSRLRVVPLRRVEELRWYTAASPAPSSAGDN